MSITQSGCKPLGHVVMAGDGHEAAADLPARMPLAIAAETTRATLRSTTLVNSSNTTTDRSTASASSRHRSQCGPGQVAAELLAVAQDAVRLDPTRRRGEADGGEKVGDLLNRPLAQSVERRPGRTAIARADRGARRTTPGRWCSCRCPRDRRSARFARRAERRGENPFPP